MKNLFEAQMHRGGPKLRVEQENGEPHHHAKHMVTEELEPGDELRVTIATT